MGGSKGKAATRAMRIHGTWYDMEGFNHPGGPIMMSLGKGRDATGLFESHHPFTSRRRLEAIMRKYETKEPRELLDDADTGAEFIWPEAETKDAQQATTEAPVSEFAKEMISRVSCRRSCVSLLMIVMFRLRRILNRRPPDDMFLSRKQRR